MVSSSCLISRASGTVIGVRPGETRYLAASSSTWYFSAEGVDQLPGAVEVNLPCRRRAVPELFQVAELFVADRLLEAPGEVGRRVHGTGLCSGSSAVPRASTRPVS